MQIELRQAFADGCNLIAVFEDDRRKQAFFDYGSARDKYRRTEWERVINLDAVTYRRQRHEARAMVERIVEKHEQRDERKPNTPVNAYNAPGFWDVFLSHGQAAAGDQCARLYDLLTKPIRDGGPGLSVWFDQEMGNVTEDAMREGVSGSASVIIFLSGDPQ